MKDELDDIKKMWQEVKESSQQQFVATNVNALITLGEAKKKSTLTAHYGNALGLTVTLAMLIFCFYYVFHFQMVLSNIGATLMIGGMALRILIEIFSALRSQRIKISDTTSQSVHNTISFYQFRKRIHGPVTILIFGLYFVGFYMLTPEFSMHLSLSWVIVMDASAVVIAIVLILIIRHGILKELKDLEKIVDIQTNLTKETEVN